MLNQNLSQLIRFNLCIFKSDEFCDWFTGDQYNYETFYMRNSAILPDHRRKGLYTALMYEFLDRVEKIGFQIVLSRHTTTNNSIIIPKLKAGFVITSLEVFDRFGTLWDASDATSKAWSKIAKGLSLELQLKASDIRSVSGLPFHECASERRQSLSSGS